MFFLDMLFPTRASINKIKKNYDANISLLTEHIKHLLSMIYIKFSYSSLNYPNESIMIPKYN